MLELIPKFICPKLRAISNFYDIYLRSFCCIVMEYEQCWEAGKIVTLVIRTISDRMCCSLAFRLASNLKGAFDSPSLHIVWAWDTVKFLGLCLRVLYKNFVQTESNLL